jgi:hypothetical protein
MRKILMGCLIVYLSVTPSHAVSTDARLLSCKFEGDGVRTMLGVVVLGTRKTIRIIWGDGSGEEWSNAQTRGSDISATRSGATVALTHQFTKIALQEENEKDVGTCRPAPLSAADKYWLAPVFRQPWQN